MSSIVLWCNRSPLMIATHYHWSHFIHHLSQLWSLCHIMPSWGACPRVGGLRYSWSVSVFRAETPLWTRPSAVSCTDEVRCLQMVSVSLPGNNRCSQIPQCLSVLLIWPPSDCISLSWPDELFFRETTRRGQESTLLNSNSIAFIYPTCTNLYQNTSGIFGSHIHLDKPEHWQCITY